MTDVPREYDPLTRPGEDECNRCGAEVCRFAILCERGHCEECCDCGVPTSWFDEQLARRFRAARLGRGLRA